MCSARDNVALPTLGFPIRASAGHWLFSASPRLIAAVHALHRLLVPRHPPCALTILTVIVEFANRDSLRRNRRFLQGKEPSSVLPVIPVSLATVQFSRSAKRRNSPRGGPGPQSSEPPAASRSLKTQQHANRLRDCMESPIATRSRAMRIASGDSAGPVDMSSGRSRSRRAAGGARERAQRRADPPAIRCPR